MIYNDLLGYSVYELPSQLYSILSSLISGHIGMDIFKSKDGENILADPSLLAKFNSRNARTIDTKKVSQHADEIINQISTFMPKPLRLHNNDFYFRIVNPNIDSSISVPHRDKYFHAITEGWIPDNGEFLVKFWFPLINVSSYALGVVPGSHKNTTKNYAKFFTVNNKRTFVSPHKREELIPVKVSPGSALIFPDLLIHGSLPSKSLDSIRLSGEITLVYNKEDYLDK